ncbi:hypothetical protein CPB86DRAFT_801411 [Serendipita vermifera]|nr:hypothetical protein CPB86DRAFT_801411 [Serendipita vermifera]
MFALLDPSNSMESGSRYSCTLCGELLGSHESTVRGHNQSFKIAKGGIIKHERSCKKKQKNNPKSVIRARVALSVQEVNHVVPQEDNNQEVNILQENATKGDDKHPFVMTSQEIGHSFIEHHTYEDTDLSKEPEPMVQHSSLTRNGQSHNAPNLFDYSGFNDAPSETMTPRTLIDLATGPMSLPNTSPTDSVVPTSLPKSKLCREVANLINPAHFEKIPNDLPCRRRRTNQIVLPESSDVTAAPSPVSSLTLPYESSEPLSSLDTRTYSSNIYNPIIDSIELPTELPPSNVSGKSKKGLHRKPVARRGSKRLRRPVLRQRAPKWSIRPAIPPTKSTVEVQNNNPIRPEGRRPTSIPNNIRFSSLETDLPLIPMEKGESDEIALARNLDHIIHLIEAIDLNDSSNQLAPDHSIPLLESIRLFFRHLIGVRKTSPVQDWPSPLYLDKTPLDFQLKAFEGANKIAGESFVSKYIASFNSSSLLLFLSVQPEFVTDSWIKRCYFEHFNWLAYAFKHSTAPKRRSAVEQRTRRRQRKHRKFYGRRKALKCHNDLLNLLDEVGIDGMSDEESDDDNEGSLRTVMPIWRSTDLSKFLQNLSLPSRGVQNCIRATDTEIPIPQGLPLNFYCVQWLLYSRDKQMKCVDSEKNWSTFTIDRLIVGKGKLLNHIILLDYLFEKVKTYPMEEVRPYVLPSNVASMILVEV